jgi:hypothetical protein
MTAYYIDIGGLGGLGLSESLEPSCGAGPTKTASVSKRLAVLGAMRTQNAGGLGTSEDRQFPDGRHQDRHHGGLGKTLTTTTYTHPIPKTATASVFARARPGGGGASGRLASPNGSNSSSRIGSLSGCYVAPGRSHRRCFFSSLRVSRP